MGIPTAIGLPRIIQRKENAPEFDYSSFYAKTGAGDPLLFGRSPAFLVTCLRTAAHGETELLTVLKIPFRVRTPSRSGVDCCGEVASMVKALVSTGSTREKLSTNDPETQCSQSRRNDSRGGA
jgi:hypothetical protein